MPWEKAYNETDVLERAMRAFWARGYAATSMKDLVEATRINRGSIYAAYTNKHGLFMAALRRYDKLHRAGYLEQIAINHDPKGAIIAAFDGAALGAKDTGNPGGCLLVNTALELSPHDPDTRDFVNACFAEVEEFFFSRIEAAQQNGTIKETVASRDTAQALLGLFIGLRVLMRTEPNGTAVNTITSQARAMLE